MPPSRRAAIAVARPGDDTRDRIIDAAQAIFARDGFVGAKMQEIADRVGIQRPSLFYHFKNKEALFAAAHEQVFARIEPLFRESLVRDGDPFVQLDRLSRAVLAVMDEEPDVARMVARTAVDRHPCAVAIVRGYLQPLVELSVEFVSRHQAQGVFRDDVDPFYLTLNSWGAALLFYTARDLLAPGEPASIDGRVRAQALSPRAPTTVPRDGNRRDRERFTRTLLQMGHRALATERRRAPTSQRGRARRSAGRE